MVGANIKKLRLQHGMTQKNLADILFVSSQAVSRWENGDVEPSIGTIRELAKVFDVTADEILGIEAIEKEDQEEESQEKLASPIRQILTLCEQCNRPLYESHEIIRIDGKVLCPECNKKNEEKQREEKLKREREIIRTAKKERIMSFIFGGLAFVLPMVFFLCVINAGNLSAYGAVWAAAVVFSVSMFTLVSCWILNNNIIEDIMSTIASWSIRAPGLIFTFDLDGILWLISMKIFFAVLGAVIGVAMFSLSVIVGAIVSLFVYPYAIVMNIRHPGE